MVGISPYVKAMGEAENGVNYVLQNIIKKEMTLIIMKIRYSGKMKT